MILAVNAMLCAFVFIIFFYLGLKVWKLYCLVRIDCVCDYVLVWFGLYTVRMRSKDDCPRVPRRVEVQRRCKNDGQSDTRTIEQRNSQGRVVNIRNKQREAAHIQDDAQHPRRL